MPVAMSSRLVPIISVGIPVATSTFSIPRRVSPRDSSMVLPCSMVWMRLSSSKFSSSSSFKRKRHLALATGGVLRQSGYASSAASTARSWSTLVDTGTLAITFPVAGLTTSFVAPLEGTNSPPTKFMRSTGSWIGSDKMAMAPSPFRCSQGCFRTRKTFSRMKDRTPSAAQSSTWIRQIRSADADAMLGRVQSSSVS